MKIEKVVEIISRLAIISVVFIPLVVANNMFFPFITGKAILFRSITEVAFFSWLFLVLLGTIPRPKITPIRITISIFVFIVALADYFGVMPERSFWSNFERMEGFVTIMYLLMYFVVAGAILRTQKHWAMFWNTSLVVTVIIAANVFGDMAIASHGERLASTLGNPIYLAVYMLFHMFIAGIFALRSNTLFMRCVYGGIILMQGTALYATGTRGAALGLIGGIFVAAISILILADHEKNKKIRQYAVMVIASVFVIVGMFFIAKDTQFVKNNPMLGRFAKVSLTEGTSMSRLVVWEIALKGIKERPLLGWGQENFNYVYNKYYDPRMYAQETWFDRTHNVMIDWLIAAGVLGLLSYLAMYGTVVFEAWRSKEFNGVETSIVIGLLAAYGIHNLFVFDNLVSYILFFSLAAWLHSSDVESSGFVEKIPWKIVGKKAKITLLIVSGIAACSFIYTVNTHAYEQNRTIVKALAKASNKETLLKSLPLFERAIGYGTYGTQEAREQLLRVASRVNRLDVPDNVKSSFLSAGLRETVAQKRDRPNDARSYTVSGRFLFIFGKYEDAKKDFKKAHDLSPDKQSILYSLAETSIKLGDVGTAVTYYKQAYELRKDNEQAAVLYAEALRLNGNIDESIEIMKKISGDGNKYIIRMYLRNEEYDKVIKIYRKQLKNDSRNPKKILSLAAVYKISGNTNEAAKLIKKALEIDSTLIGRDGKLRIDILE